MNSIAPELQMDLALTMLIILNYWLIGNQSRCINESRNAITLKYDF